MGFNGDGLYDAYFGFLPDARYAADDSRRTFAALAKQKIVRNGAPFADENSTNLRVAGRPASRRGIFADARGTTLSRIAGGRSNVRPGVRARARMQRHRHKHCATNNAFELGTNQRYSPTTRRTNPCVKEAFSVRNRRFDDEAGSNRL